MERLFSHWTMLRGRWTTSPDWPEFITEFRPSQTPTALPDVPSLAFKQRSGVARGYYGDQLSRGLSIFPREQWLWLEFRAMLADFPTAMNQLTDFLGVDRYHRPPEPAQVMSGPARVVGTAPTATDLASLAQLYSADLAQFRSIADLDIDAWPTVRILSGRMSPAELAERFAARVEARPDPAVSIRSSVKRDHVVCLEDGKKMKMLKRHLMTDHGLTPDEYRARWGLASDYPMVAPDYADKRRDLAKKIGLGRKPGQRRGRRKKTA